RLRGLGWLPARARAHLVAALGEFAGTCLFLSFAFAGTHVANAAAAGQIEAAGGSEDADAARYPNTPVLLYISLAFGFSLAVNAWVFMRISGGLFNPAVTLGMCLIGAVPWLRGLIDTLAQIAGAIAASALVLGLFPGTLAVRTTLHPSTSHVRGLLIEALLTAELVFAIFMLAAEKHKGTFLAPIGVGLCLFVCELAGVYYTGGSLNPARSFGPDVVLGTFDSYHWIYWAGPAIGAVAAVLFYRLVKVLEDETESQATDVDEKAAEPLREDKDPDTAGAN
ncbi:aquaporin-like protein, partial [Lineolata rhizophorae]